MGSLQVTLASLDGTERLDMPQSGWELTAFDGWEDLPALRDTASPRALGDGSFPRMQGYRGGMSGSVTMLWEGTAEAVAAQARTIRARLGRMAWMTVTDHDGIALTRRIDVVSATPANRHLPDERLEVAWVWDAPDPIAYGPVTVRTSGEQVRNLGQVAVSPVVQVVGPVSGPLTITERETGRTMIWVGQLATGQVLRLDPQVGVAVVDGVPSLGMRRADWPLVPPGKARSYIASPGLAGRLQILERAGW